VAAAGEPAPFRITDQNDDGDEADQATGTTGRR
jgi:hypothetical protein